MGWLIDQNWDRVAGEFDINLKFKMELPRASICIATQFYAHLTEDVYTYYLKKQLESISEQLSEGDEVYISDDGDGRIPRIHIDNIFANIENRVLLTGAVGGVRANFQRLLETVRNNRGTEPNIIVLADQDDIWKPGRLKAIREHLGNNGNSLVHLDCSEIDPDTEKQIIPSFIKTNNAKTGCIKNISRNSYRGCCMAFSADTLDYILPIPQPTIFRDDWYHDQWIGNLIDWFGTAKFSEVDGLAWRKHHADVTISGPRPIYTKIANRATFLCKFILRIFSHKMKKVYQKLFHTQ